MAGFGIVEAAQRARDWSPHLATEGQRLVLAGLVVYTGADSVADPSSGQLAAYTGYTARAVRRILTRLVDLGVIAPLSDRDGGRGKTTQWTIKPGPVSPGIDMETRTGESGFGGSGTTETRTLEAETRTGEARNPDPARSSTESSEISEDCVQHQFESRAVGSAEFQYCASCGISASKAAPS